MLSGHTFKTIPEVICLKTASLLAIIIMVNLHIDKTNYDIAINAKEKDTSFLPIGLHHYQKTMSINHRGSRHLKNRASLQGKRGSCLNASIS